MCMFNSSGYLMNRIGLAWRIERRNKFEYSASIFLLVIAETDSESMENVSYVADRLVHMIGTRKEFVFINVLVRFKAPIFPHLWPKEALSSSQNNLMKEAA
jgi:hypothetical protein